MKRDRRKDHGELDRYSGSQEGGFASRTAMRLQCEEGSKGRWEAINHSVPAADEPIARARAGAAPRDRVPAQRHDAKPSARQAAEAWFPSAYASVPSPRPLAPAPNA